MPRRLTRSFRRLRRNLDRGTVLLDRFFDRPGGRRRASGQPRAHEQELLRSVLVLAIGALDAYLSDLLIELLPNLASLESTSKVFDQLARDNPGLVLRAIYLGGNSAEQALAQAIEAHFEGKVMHGSRAVRQVTDWSGLGLGNADFNSSAFPDALGKLDEWTDKRHRIVHRGELVRIGRPEASDVIGLIRSIGQTLNDKALRMYP